MAKIKHPTVTGATNESHPHLFKEDGTPRLPETDKWYFKKDGTPREPMNYADRGPIVKRPADVRLAELKDKKVKLTENFKEQLAALDEKITKLEAGGAVVVDPEVAEKAAAGLFAAGYTPEAIAQMKEAIRNAEAAFKGKTPEEIEAMRVAAMANKPAAAVEYEDEEVEAA